MVTDRRCTATRKRGGRCEGMALAGETLCFAHSPSVRERRAAARRRGGQAKSSAARAARQWAAAGREIAVDDLPAMLRAMIPAVAAGELEPGRATAIAQLARTATQIDEAVDIERRLAALEQRNGVGTTPSLRRVS